jgi:hypothetical protein
VEWKIHRQGRGAPTETACCIIRKIVEKSNRNRIKRGPPGLFLSKRNATPPKAALKKIERKNAIAMGREK